MLIIVTCSMPEDLLMTAVHTDHHDSVSRFMRVQLYKAIHMIGKKSLKRTYAATNKQGISRAVIYSCRGIRRLIVYERL